MEMQPRSPVVCLYLLSSLRSSSHGHTPLLYLYFVIPPLMLLITDESWDSPGPWQKPEEHRSDSVLLDSHGLLFQMFRLHPIPQLLPEVCLQDTLPIPASSASELPARIIARDSAIPQCHLSDMRNILPVSVLTSEKSHLILQTLWVFLKRLCWRRQRNQGIGGLRNCKS